MEKPISRKTPGTRMGDVPCSDLGQHSLASIHLGYVFTIPTSGNILIPYTAARLFVFPHLHKVHPCQFIVSLPCCASYISKHAILPFHQKFLSVAGPIVFKLQSFSNLKLQTAAPIHFALPWWLKQNKLTSYNRQQAALALLTQATLQSEDQAELLLWPHIKLYMYQCSNCVITH